MNKSIYLALFILASTIIWLVSGQIGGTKDKKKADEVTEVLNLSAEENNIENDVNLFKVETKIFNYSKIDQSIILQGQTIHNKKIDIKAETIGNITSINFKRGDRVKKGTSLITISKENRTESLKTAQELIKLYEVEHSSIKKLIDKGLGSKSKLSLASYNLADAKSKLRSIELDIQNTNIRAPFDGIITQKKIEVSDYVTPGNILLTIVNLNPIKVKAYLSEFDVNKIKLNTKAYIENSNGKIKEGIITFISPTAETNTRTFEITIEADNFDLSFKSGITSSVTIKGIELMAQKIPPSVLTLKDDGTIGVKVLNENNIVEFYPIHKAKDTIDGMWVSGLPNSVNLIITGQEYVSIGQKIALK